MNPLKRALIAYNAWQLADLIALRIEAAAQPCAGDIHLAGCLPCTLAQQARRDAALARTVGAGRG